MTETGKGERRTVETRCKGLRRKGSEEGRESKRRKNGKNSTKPYNRDFKIAVYVNG